MKIITKINNILKFFLTSLMVCFSTQVFALDQEEGAMIPAPVSGNTAGEIYKEHKELKITIGGKLRLRYERWRNGDLVPDQSSRVSRANPGAANAWRSNYDDDYTLTNLKLHANVEITESLSAFIELEHATIESSSKIREHRRYKSKLHLQQAYLLYNDSVNQLKIGRQILDYGSRLILGTNSWINNTISYDVVRYDYFSEAFTASMFGGYEAFEPNDDIDQDNLVGGYHFTFNPMGWHLEQYTFYKDHDRKLGFDDFDAYSVGARIKNSWNKYEMDLDLVKQFGDRRGFATHGFIGRYLKPGHWSQLRLFTSFNVASGGTKDKDDYVAFAPAGHLDRQSTDFAPYINLKEYGFGLTANPIKNQPLYVRFSWFDMYKYNKRGAIYSFDGNTIVWGKGVLPPGRTTSSQSSHLGQHISLFASYKIAKTNTELTACINKYFIDSAIDDFPNRDDTNFFYISVTQSF